MKTKRLVTILLVFIAVYALSVVLFYHWFYQDFEDVVDMDVKWDISLNGEEIGQNQEADDAFGSDFKVEKGDVLVYDAVLSDMGELDSPAFLIKERYCSYEIYFDGKLIESHHMDEVQRENGYVGLDQCIFSIPKDYVGKPVTIKMYVLEDVYITGMESCWFGNFNSLKLMFFRMYTIGYVTAMFLIIFGAIYLYLSFIFTPLFSYMGQYIPLGFLSIEMGVVIFTRFGLGFIFMDDVFASVLYEVALLLIVPLGLWCEQSILGKSSSALIRRLSYLIGGMGVLLIVLRLLKIVHLPEISALFAILVAATFFLFSVRMIHHYYVQKKNEDKKVLIIAMSVCAFFTLIAFSFSGFRHLEILPRTAIGNLTEVAIMCVGPMFFAYFILMDFLFNISAVYARKQEYDSLTRLAYQDGLTHIPNRGKANRYIDELEKRQRDYCILSIDVNGLKQINDTYGHGYGDKLLINFSKILEKVYEKEFYARIGGDEFLVVFENATDAIVEESIEKLKTELDVLNTITTDSFIYSAAVGYAYRHETKNDHTHQTYLLADERMYEDKKQYHKDIEKD
ncbi:MAG: GGDEF domain-containing protein [Lachnospiraceae bacterium]|nr:GGDEF domain-containing protein [Lachnospiraceae bacterium]